MGSSRIGFELQEVDDLLGLPPLRNLVPLRPPPVEGRGERARVHVDVPAHQDVVERGHPAEQCQVLEGAGDAEARDPVRAHAGYVLALEQDFAVLRREEAGNRVEESGFSAAVRAHEAEDFAAPQVERHALERLQAAEAARNPVANQQMIRRPCARQGGRLALPRPWRFLQQALIGRLGRRIDAGAGARNTPSVECRGGAAVHRPVWRYGSDRWHGDGSWAICEACAHVKNATVLFLDRRKPAFAARIYTPRPEFEFFRDSIGSLRKGSKFAT